jgi:hypothetical protein
MSRGPLGGSFLLCLFVLKLLFGSQTRLALREKLSSQGGVPAAAGKEGWDIPESA